MAKNIPELPILQRKEKVQIFEHANLQKATEEYAASDNSMSAIGAHIATQANNALAVKMGYESGKNPQGDILPPFTEFDKNFVAGYNAQAQATLTTQADKLFNDINLKMSKARRLNPELIASTQSQLKTGLARISSYAPTELKSKLEGAFDSQLNSSMTQYQERMIKEQRGDEAERLTNSLYINTKKIQELASQGDFKGSELILNNLKSMAHGGAGIHLISPAQATKAFDTAQQTFLDAKYSKLALDAKKNGTYEEFTKNYAEHKPEGMTAEQWINTGQALEKQVQFYDGLTKQSQNLALDDFHLAIVDGSATEQMLSDLKDKVNHHDFIDAKIKFIKANKERTGYSQRSLNLSGQMTNKDLWSGSTIREKNDSFDLNVNAHLSNAQKNGKQLTPAEAKLKVAMNAAGTVPKYVEELNEKGLGNNPIDILEAGHSVEVMYSSGNAQKLKGLDSRVLDNFHAFQNFRQTTPDINEAAIKAHEAVLAKKPEQIEANSAALKAYYKKKLGTSEQPWQYMMRLTSISPGQIVSNQQAYGQKLQTIFEDHFNALNGDVASAEKITKMEEKQLFGTTHVNGKNEFTYLPIENHVPIPSDGIGIIKSDINNQLEKQFAPIKKMYDEGKSEFYYEVKPRINVEDVYKHLKESEKLKPAQRAVFEANLLEKFNEGKVEIIKHQRHNEPLVYEAYLQANPYSAPTTDPSNPVTGGWEVKLKSKNRIENLSLPGTVDGMTVYRPDYADIKANYELINLRGYQHKRFANLKYKYKTAEAEPILNVGIM